MPFFAGAEAAPAQSFRELAGLPPVDSKWQEYCRANVQAWATAEGYDLSKNESPNLTLARWCQISSADAAQSDIAEKERLLRQDIAQMAAEQRRGPIGGSDVGVTLVSSPDIGRYYPKASIRNGETGTTLVGCTLDKDGRPRGCRVTKSSGYERLDKAAVAVVSEQVYRATTNASVAGVAIQRPIRWSLE